MIKAPWTKEQVENLNRFQKFEYTHPFTCGNNGCGDELVAHEEGWKCPSCDYTQDWAHEHMTLFTKEIDEQYRTKDPLQGD